MEIFLKNLNVSLNLSYLFFNFWLKAIEKRFQIFFYNNLKLNMVEPLLSGIVLGLIGVTIPGLFVTAYLQYRRGDLASF